MSSIHSILLRIVTSGSQTRGRLNNDIFKGAVVIFIEIIISTIVSQPCLALLTTLPICLSIYPSAADTEQPHILEAGGNVLI